jgi:hypothetical protein
LSPTLRILTKDLTLTVISELLKIVDKRLNEYVIETSRDKKEIKHVGEDSRFKNLR